MSKRYLVVSSDSHAGPSLERSLRQHCPAAYVDEFDRFVAGVRSGAAGEKLGHVEQVLALQLGPGADSNTLRDNLSRTLTCVGHDDPMARLTDMDEAGIAAELIFAGGQNAEALPFVGFGADAGPRQIPVELRHVGEEIWNSWLSEYVSAAPERLLGVMQIPIWDIELAARAVEHWRGKGLRAVNLPAPRSDLRPYNDPAYERLWHTCEALRVPLVTHAGGGEAPLGFVDPQGHHYPGGMMVYAYERFWLARRHLWEMIFGGVFERHPDLKLVVTEQMVSWVPQTLADLDNIYSSTRFANLADKLPRPPSDYWHQNCFNSGSFLARHEVEMRHEVGLGNLLWGSDYPHVEGTWPNTRLAMRYTFGGVPAEDRRAILGETAVDVYALDRRLLDPVAERIGPTDEELDLPVDELELPTNRVHAFRQFENF